MGDVQQASLTHTLTRDAIEGGAPALTARLTPADGVAGTNRTACVVGGTAIEIEKKTAGHWWPIMSTPINDFRQGARMEQVPSLPAGSLDAIVVLGQSNASGRGTSDPGIDPYPQNGSRLFYLGPEMDIVTPPTEPIDDDGTYPVYTALSEGVAVGYGPAVATLHYLSAKAGWTDRQIVACVCAKGGTSSADWARDTAVTSLYGAAMARILWLQRYATVRAVVLYQGETDAFASPVEWATNWRQIRSDMEADGLAAVPWVIVVLPTAAATGSTTWADVRANQADMAGDASTSSVQAGEATIDSGLHLDTAAQLALGSDLADAIDAAVVL